MYVPISDGELGFDVAITTGVDDSDGAGGNVGWVVGFGVEVSIDVKKVSNTACRV
jgi:hypothetical protein